MFLLHLLHFDLLQPLFPKVSFFLPLSTQILVRTEWCQEYLLPLEPVVRLLLGQLLE